MKARSSTYLAIECGITYPQRMGVWMGKVHRWATEMDGDIGARRGVTRKASVADSRQVSCHANPWDSPLSDGHSKIQPWLGSSNLRRVPIGLRDSATARDSLVYWPKDSLVYWPRQGRTGSLGEVTACSRRHLVCPCGEHIPIIGPIQQCLEGGTPGSKGAAWSSQGGMGEGMDQRVGQKRLWPGWTGVRLMMALAAGG